MMDCWVDNMILRYDTDTHTTSNNDGVEVRVPGFGNTTTVEWLDTSRRSCSLYFARQILYHKISVKARAHLPNENDRTWCPQGQGQKYVYLGLSTAW